MKIMLYGYIFRKTNVKSAEFKEMNKMVQESTK